MARSFVLSALIPYGSLCYLFRQLFLSGHEATSLTTEQIYRRSSLPLDAVAGADRVRNSASGPPSAIWRIRVVNDVGAILRNKSGELGEVLSVGAMYAAVRV